MTEKRTPGVLLVYLCHFLLSSFYRGHSCATRLRSCSRDKNLELEDPPVVDEYPRPHVHCIFHNANNLKTRRKQNHKTYDNEKLTVQCVP